MEEQKQSMNSNYFKGLSRRDYIQKAHDDYLVRKHDVEDDIHHIIEVNYKALDGMTQLLAKRREEFRLRHS